ncbi:hypothetical protein V5K10_004164 [Enterobacter asburiae]
MVSIIISIGVFFISNNNHEKLTCSSQFTIVSDYGSISSFSRFIFSNGKGQYDSVGNIAKKSSPPEKLTRRMSFIYWRNDDFMVLVSEENNQNRDDLMMMMPDVPDFFLRKNGAMVMKIYKTGDSTMLLAQDNSPVLFCKEGQGSIDPTR